MGDGRRQPGSLVGIVRAIDRPGRRYRIGLGQVPPGDGAWELGAAPTAPVEGGVPVWTDTEDQLVIGGTGEIPGPARATEMMRWVLAPLRWTDTGSLSCRLRALTARASDSLRLLARRRIGVARPRSARDGQPVLWLYGEHAAGRVPLHLAHHPVTGQQLVSRDAHEAAELGYRECRPIGFLAGEAPVTGSLVRPPQSVPWGSRFGRRLTGAGDPLAQAPSEPDVPLFVPLGHYYSPVPDPGEVLRHRARIWPATPPATPDIDWREADQLESCGIIARTAHLAFPSSPGGPDVYWSGNDQFPPMDAWVLAAFLEHDRPARMVEVGSGYSSLVTAQVNRERLGGTLDLTCIEPHPRQFLIDGVEGIATVRVEQVQDTPPAVFDALGSGDVLFVDTSHVVRTGGDVVWLFGEIIPRLAAGVHVHVHDIFLPGDYPAEWVAEGRAWNENYFVRAFLAYNSDFAVRWGSAYMLRHHADRVSDAFPEPVSTGGSLWLRRERISRPMTSVGRER